jgi:hypothetical protein
VFVAVTAPCCLKHDAFVLMGSVNAVHRCCSAVCLLRQA